MKEAFLLILIFTFCQSLRSQESILVFEKAPEFPGGDKKLFESIQDSMIYPYDAFVKKIGGRVYVSFWVDTTGIPRDIQVIKGIRDDLDLEAKRIASVLPKWIPGEQNHKKITIRTAIPIVFDPKKKVKVGPEIKQNY